MSQKGFTLAGLLLVVVILGILAAVVVPQFSETDNERRVRIMGDVGVYADTLGDSGRLGKGDGVFDDTDKEEFMKEYMARITTSFEDITLMAFEMFLKWKESQPD